MADEAGRGPEQAWDRVGRFFEDLSQAGEAVAQRNLALWSSVSQNIRGEEYGADQMARDTARALSTALDNLDDIWTSLTRAPQRDETAGALPEVFLYIALKEDAVRAHGLAGPVWIDVAPKELEKLPDRGAISLFGPQDGIEDLQARLLVTRVLPRGYKVEVVQAGDKQLTPGFYSGVVYTTDPVRPLASLRVVVESGEPPAPARAAKRTVAKAAVSRRRPRASQD